MLITRFNKLIRSRIVWGSFAFLVALFFIGTGIFSRSGYSPEERRGSAEGRLFDRDVPIREFQMARFFEMGMQTRRDTSQTGEDDLRHQTWVRLAALRHAQDLGIVVSDDEVRDAITRDPGFAVQGVFDSARYHEVLVHRLGITAALFEDYVREDLILGKYHAALRASVWTTPYEINPRLERLTDRLAVAHVVIARDGMERDIAIDEAEARRYFEANRDAFAVPERRQVRFVAFPVTNYLAKTAVSADAVAASYEDNLHRYTQTDDDGIVSTQSLETAEAAIRDALRERDARLLARDAATVFVMALAPDRYGRAMALDEAAAAKGLTVQTSAWFSVAETIPDLNAGKDLTAIAFRLLPGDPERYFSDPYLGADQALVLATHEQAAPRDATFDEVRDEVLAAVRTQAAEDAFRAQVAERREALAAALERDETTFAEAAEALGLTSFATELFTVYEGLPEDHPYPYDLLPVVIDLEPGMLSDPVWIDDGALIAAALRRMPGDPDEAEMLRPRFRQSMEQYRTAALMDAWSDYLLAMAGFQDYRAFTTDPFAETEDIP